MKNICTYLKLFVSLHRECVTSNDINNEKSIPPLLGSLVTDWLQA